VEEERRLRRLRKDLQLRQETLTAAIEAAESRIGEIDALFCQNGFFDRASEERVRSLQAEQQDLRSEAERLMSDWESVELELARLA